jgi:hypothetical protein
VEDRKCSRALKEFDLIFGVLNAAFDIFGALDGVG